METRKLHWSPALGCFWLPGLVLAACSWGSGGPVAGHLEGNKPVGLFFMTMDHGYTASYYFSPDGSAYLNPLGLSDSTLGYSDRHGSYSVSGKTLSIGWLKNPNNYETESNDVGLRPGGFGWGRGCVFSAGGPFKSHSQLVGTFEGNDSAYVAMHYGGVVYQSLTFKADSTYTGSRTDTAAAVTKPNGAKTSATTQQAGRWKLDGWFLTLTDAQGHTTRDIAFPGGSSSSKIIHFYFNNLKYKRQ